MRFLTGLALAAALAAPAGADDRKDAPLDAAKLLGKWEPAEPAKDARTVLEFDKGGKAALTVRFENSTARLEGTYTLDGDRLTVVLKAGPKEERTAFTVRKLTDAVLEYEDARGRSVAMRRIPK